MLSSLTAAICRPRSTIYDHLMDLIFTIGHLKWVPDMFPNAHRKLRVDISRQLLDVIAQARHQSRKLFLTVDESWFYFPIDYTRVWLLPDSEPPSRARKAINTENSIVTILWSRTGSQSSKHSQNEKLSHLTTSSRELLAISSSMHP
jgi:hypothetical protein